MEALAGSAAFLAQLRRDPDFDAAELLAYDASDELLLATAQESIDELAPGELVVIGDRHGALTLGAAALLGATGIRTFQDPLLGERALHQNAARLGFTAATFTSHALDAQLLTGARVVLLQLPRGLDALAEIAEAIALWAHPEVRVFAGGRIKHMTHAMNGVLERFFTTVTAGLGWRKSRVLTAAGSRDCVRAASSGAQPAGVGTQPTEFPRWGSDPALGFQVAAFGATFGGPTLDRGSRLLLADLDSAAPAATRLVDLGCGNGSLAVAAARARPHARVIATDQSAAAVAATALTAEAAGVAVVGTDASAADGCGHTHSADEAPGVCIHRADGLESVPDAWAELILLNPPFHTGATVHAGVAHRLIEACSRALAPGGELRIVFNSHLRYRPLIERVVGPVRQVARDRTFTVLSAIRQDPRGR